MPRECVLETRVLSKMRTKNFTRENEDDAAGSEKIYMYMKGDRDSRVVIVFPRGNCGYAARKINIPVCVCVCVYRVLFLLTVKRMGGWGKKNFQFCEYFFS